MNELEEMTVPLMKHMKDVTDSYQSGYDKALEDIQRLFAKDLYQLFNSETVINIDPQFPLAMPVEITNELC